LALAYAQTHPEAVTELVLRGIFMLRRWELEWFYQEGASRLFADAWEHYLGAIPPVERGDLISAYHRRLTGDDASVRLAAARAWSVWEASTSFLLQDLAYIETHKADDFALAFARIESHYFVNGGFFECEDQLLRDAHRLAKIPGTIVQGRYDVVCPMQSAWDLKKAWPQAELCICPSAGHSAFEPQIIDALVRATDGYALTVA
jgi:proline iminopeptidase